MLIKRIAFSALILATFIEAVSWLPYVSFAAENALAQCSVMRDTAEVESKTCCLSGQISLVCSRGGLSSVLGRVALAAFVIFLISLIALSFMGRADAAIGLTAGIAFALTFSHAVKLHFLGEPLFLSDFFPSTLITFGAVVMGLAWPVKFALCISLLVISVPFFWAIQRSRRSHSQVSVVQRIAALSVGLLLLSAIQLGRDVPFWRFATGLRPQYLNSTQNFYNLGAIGFWLFELPKLRFGTDSPHSQDQRSVFTKPKVQPDIFVILVESLWLPELVATIGYKEYPMPYFRSLLASHGGYLQVAAFGGGTPKTEFEVLTGLSSLDIDGFPYVSVVRQPMRSLATMFRRSGYQTHYAHPYKAWMFNRMKAMPWLGFEHLYFETEIRRDATLVPRDDLYFDDVSFFDYLCRLPNGKAPHFISAATYGTHGPFRNRNIAEYPIQLKVDIGIAERKALAKNLALVRRFDDGLKAFVHCLAQRKRPSLILVYGDHWPNYSYLDFGLLWGDSPRSNFSRTGYFMLPINYAAKLNPKPLTSPNWLHLDVAAAAHLPPDRVAHELAQIREVLPVLGIYKSTGKLLVRDLPRGGAADEMQMRYRQLQDAVLYNRAGLD